MYLARVRHFVLDRSGNRAKSATLLLNGENLETKPVNAGAKKVVFEAKLTKGKHKLSPFFKVPEGELGCYYALIKSK